MTYVSLRAAIADCLTIVDDKPNTIVCLATKGAKQTAPILSRLQLTDELSESFFTNATDILRELARNVAAGDVELKAYDAAIPQDKHEIEIHEPPAGTAPQIIVESLKDLAQVGLFDGDQKFVNKLIFHVISIQRAEKETIYFFRRYTKTKELSQSQKLFALFRDGTLDKLNERVFVFDNLVDALWLDGKMLIFSKDGYHRIFNYFEEVLAHAKTTLDTLRTSIPIENFEGFEKDCMGHALIMSKLSGIATRSYLKAIPFEKWEEHIAVLGLPIEVSGTGADKKLVYDPKVKWKFVRLLDDGFLNSSLTKLSYEVTAKRLKE